MKKPDSPEVRKCLDKKLLAVVNEFQAWLKNR
jgi:hypothetical protein